MNNGKKVLLGLAAGVTLMVGAAATTFAADPTVTPTPSAYCQPGTGMLGAQVGGRWGNAMNPLESVSKLLGIDVSKIIAERQAGKSLAQIAQNNGKSRDDVVKAIVADRQKLLDAQVAAGNLTKEQAALILERMQAQVPAMVDQTEVGPRGGMMGGRGAGMQGMMSGQGPRYQQDGSTPTEPGAGPRMGGGFVPGFNR